MSILFKALFEHLLKFSLTTPASRWAEGSRREGSERSPAQTSRRRHLPRVPSQNPGGRSFCPGHPPGALFKAPAVPTGHVLATLEPDF